MQCWVLQFYHAARSHVPVNNLLPGQTLLCVGCSGKAAYAGPCLHVGTNLPFIWIRYPGVAIPRGAFREASAPALAHGTLRITSTYTSTALQRMCAQGAGRRSAHPYWQRWMPSTATYNNILIALASTAVAQLKTGTCRPILALASACFSYSLMHVCHAVHVRPSA